MERQNNGQTACTDVSGELVTRIKQSEDDFKRAVIELAQLNGWLVHHGRPAMNRKGAWATWQDGDNGFPDLTLARGGRVILAELKREKAKPSEAQMEWIEALGQPPACVWYPSTWNEIDRTLR